MKYKELAEIYRAQNEVLTRTVEALQCSVDSQSKTIESLTKEISELKGLLLEKNKGAEKLVAKLNGVTKIALPKKTERRNYSETPVRTVPAPTPKERGNNGAKRKEYNNIEEVTEEIEPSHADFNLSDAKFISFDDVIRYEYLPQRLIKHIYQCKNYSFNDTVYSGKAPAAPLLNSNFDSSVIANMIQLRYVYGMPVERIVKQYEEMGFALPK